jgi:predicted small secreted protein
MQWRKKLLVAAVGAAIGVFIGKSLKTMRISPEKALHIAKQKFKEKGSISDSWIYMKPQPYSKEDLDYTVYHGGITRTINGVSKPFEFYIDAKTGTIIDVHELNTDNNN